MSIFTKQCLTAHAQALPKCVLRNLLAKRIELLLWALDVFVCSIRFACANTGKNQKDIIDRMC